jgi:hypothetical protein
LHDLPSSHSLECSLCSHVCAIYIYNIFINKLNLCRVLYLCAMYTAAAAAIEQQQPSVTTSTKTTSNGNSSSSANSVLHRVISLTTANHNENNNYTKPSKPAFIPEKLHFSAYEKFEGEQRF